MLRPRNAVRQKLQYWRLVCGQHLAVSSKKSSLDNSAVNNNSGKVFLQTHTQQDLSFSGGKSLLVGFLSDV